MPSNANAYDPSLHGPVRVVGPGFFTKVFELVAEIPEGHVSTYGDVAQALGLRSVARKVGHALAAIPDDRRDIPWHRVINAKGAISRPVTHGSGRDQLRLLRAEGHTVDTTTGRVASFAKRRFQFPDHQA